GGAARGAPGRGVRVRRGGWSGGCRWDEVADADRSCRSTALGTGRSGGAPCLLRYLVAVAACGAGTEGRVSAPAAAERCRAPGWDGHHAARPASALSAGTTRNAVMNAEISTPTATAKPM